jgi:hypothetical protein
MNLKALSDLVDKWTGAEVGHDDVGRRCHSATTTITAKLFFIRVEEQHFCLTLLFHLKRFVFVVLQTKLLWNLSTTIHTLESLSIRILVSVNARQGLNNMKLHQMTPKLMRDDIESDSAIF